MERILLFFGAGSERQPVIDALSVAFEVLCADGAPALQLPFDLCLVDMHVLDEHGEAIAQRRREESPAHLPVLLVAWREDVERVRPHLQASIDDVLWLPIEPLVLQARTRSLLRARAAERALEQRVAQRTEQLEHSQGRLRMLLEAIRALAAARTREAVLAAVRPAARQLAGADGATFVLRDGDQCWYVDEDAIGPLWKGERFPMDACVSGWAMRHREPAVIEDMRTDDRVPVALYEKTFVRGLVLVPIDLREPVGAIGNYWAKPHRATEQEIELLQSLADAVAIALRNVRTWARLQQQVAQRTAQLRAAKLQAEDASKMKSAFLTIMSHELRTPMNSIVGFTSVMMRGLSGPVTDEQRRQLEIVRTAGRRMLAQINDLLDLSRIEAGQMVLRQEAYDLEDELRQVVGIGKPLAQNKGLELTLAIDPRLASGRGRLVGDPARVQQVVLNLLSNAVKFTDAGGIAVRAEVLEDAGMVRIEVEDTGIGIGEDDLHHLFLPFSQVDPTQRAGRGGSGLGLAISRGLAGAMGGRISVRSAPGRGSVFALEMPGVVPTPVEADAGAGEREDSQ